MARWKRQSRFAENGNRVSVRLLDGSGSSKDTLAQELGVRGKRIAHGLTCAMEGNQTQYLAIVALSRMGSLMLACRVGYSAILLSV